MENLLCLLILLSSLNISCAQAPYSAKATKGKPTQPTSPQGSDYGALQSVVVDVSLHDAVLAPEEEKKLAVARIDAQIEQIELRQDWTKFKIGLLTAGTAIISVGGSVLAVYISGQCKK